jgi:prepilin-type N-terminal cleavage/methylation domain-containing protein
MRGKYLARSGFTLIELMVVLVIVLMVSILTIPTVVHSYQERSIRSAVDLITQAMATARDRAAAINSPCGIRFLWDPTLSNWTYPDGTVGQPPNVVLDIDGKSNEIMFNPDGSVFFSSPYGVPTAQTLGAHEAKIHLTDRGRAEFEAWIIVNMRTGQIETDIRTP